MADKFTPIKQSHPIKQVAWFVILHITYLAHLAAMWMWLFNNEIRFVWMSIFWLVISILLAASNQEKKK